MTFNEPLFTDLELKKFEKLQQKDFDYWVSKKWFVKNKFNNWVLNSNKKQEYSNYTSEYFELFTSEGLPQLGFTSWDLALFYLIHQDNPVNHKCSICGKIIWPNLKTSRDKFSKTCSSECQKIQVKRTLKEKYGSEIYNNKEKQKQTCLEKYGVDNPSKAEECKEKFKQTCIQKYGVDNYAKTKEYKEKRKQTCLKKYGVDNYTQTKECKEKYRNTCLQKYGVDNPFKALKFINKIKQTCIQKYEVDNYAKTLEFKNKYKQTCIQKYGVKNYFQSQEFKEKYKKTNIEKYGVEHYSQSQEFLEKVKRTWESKPRDEVENIVKKLRDTCLQKYGVDNYTKTEEYRKKAKQTCIKKYGVDHYFQSLMAAKYHKSRYEYNNIKFDSSWELYFYIYYKEIKKQEIIRSPITFTYTYNSNNKVYIPDFLVDGKYIEIKGGHFLKTNKNGEVNMFNPFDESKNTEYQAKYECMLKNNVIILSGQDLKPIINEVQKLFGRNYVKQFKKIPG